MKLIKDILNSEGDKKILSVELDVVKDLGKNYYVVADDGGDSIMLDMNQKEDATHNVSEGSRIRMIKPKVSGDVPKMISPDKFKVINIGQSKSEKVPKLSKEEMSKYEEHVDKQRKVEGTTLNDTEKMEKNIVIPEMSVFSVGVSRIIDGKYGPYQIGNFKDLAGNKGSLNLYGAQVGKMEPGKTYTLKKFVKSGMTKGEGEFTRLAVKYGSVNQADESIAVKFISVKVGEHEVTGQIIGITEVQAKENIEEGKKKFNATLYVQCKDDVEQIKISEWNLKKEVPDKVDTEDWLNSELLSKEVVIEADQSYSGEGLSAVRMKVKSKNPLKQEKLGDKTNQVGKSKDVKKKD